MVRQLLQSMGVEGMSSFTYDMTWEQIENKLNDCVKRQQFHLKQMQNCKKSERMYHMRQYKGLEGAIATLRWVLGDRDYDPLVGRTEHV